MDGQISWLGYPFDRDRMWEVTKGDFKGFLKDYNWEVTGYTENMIELGARYSTSAYWLLGKLREEGYEIVDLGTQIRKE